MIQTVGYESECLKAQAEALAEQLNFVLDKEAIPCLFMTSEGLALKLPNFSLLYPDFSVKTWSKRKSEGKKQGLVRACKPCKGLTIIDATAGWGKDAAILASLGAKVLLIERNPVMASLLRDALARRTELDKQELDISLYEGNASSFLRDVKFEDHPDVIYIDPMHPERSKSALVKKDMQALQQLIGPDEDALELITIARSRVKQRVVVKWPQKISPLLPADASIVGKTIRFDLFFPIQS